MTLARRRSHIISITERFFGGESKRDTYMFIGNAIVVTHFFAGEALREHIKN